MPSSLPSRLYGRRADCDALDVVVGAVNQGLSGSLVLVGEPGIGKTRLLDYVVGEAAGLRVERICGVESEVQLGYAGLHRLLLPFLGHVGRLPAPQRGALSSALGLAAGPPPSRFLVALSALTLLADVAADRPLVCIIDDAHWLDQESIDILAFVGRRLHADSIGLLIAVRDSSPVLAALDGLRIWRVGGLAGRDAYELLSAAVTGRLDAHVAERIVTETGGNPLALIQLADDLTEAQLAGGAPLPAGLPLGRPLEAHFSRRVAAMPMPTQSLLLLIAAATLDQPEVIWQAAASVGLPASAADPAVADGILTLNPELAFRHPLVRSAVYHSAAPAARRLAHQTLAAVIDRARDPDQRAAHLAAATLGPDEAVASELERSAERARMRGGFSAEAALLSWAADLSPRTNDRARRLLACTQAHLGSGDIAQAQATLAKASGLDDSPLARAAEIRLRAALDFQLLDPAAVPATLLTAVASLGPDDALISRGLLFIAMQASLTCQQGFDDVARAARAITPSPAGGAAASDLLLEGMSARIVGDVEYAVPALRAGLDAILAGDIGETALTMSPLVMFAAEEAWDEGRGAAATEYAVELTRARGSLTALPIALVSRSMWHTWAGQFDETQACLAAASELCAAMGFWWGDVCDAAARVELLAWQGQESETRKLADHMRAEMLEQTRQPIFATFAMVSLVVLELGLGRYSDALRWARPVYDADLPAYGGRVLPDIVEAGIRVGDAALAAAAFERLSKRAAAAASPWALGLAARCRALMADDLEAEAHYLQSVQLLTQTSMRAQLARSHLLYGEWLRRQRRRTDARDQLRTAHQLFDRMGANLFAERARTELLATGERARKRSEPADRHLTPQETSVAALAAGGATNSEIATRLFLSSSTVDYHLSKVFRKLGITSRRQLAAVLSK